MNKTEAGRAGKKIPERKQERKSTPSSAATAQNVAAPATKADKIVALLREPSGATLKAIMAATAWQPHSVRGFISAQLIKKRKLRVKSFKRDGERVYKIPR
jgi:Protein of unknown function (DUF3489)